MKKVIKFNFEGKEGFLSLVEIDQYPYALVKKDTPKVSDILINHKLAISFELKKDATFQEVEAHVSFDPKLIERVYRQLEIEKNLYFKSLDESLCVIQLVIQ